MIISSPLSVPISKNKNFTLNLNKYRNAHYQILNSAKVNYKAVMYDQIMRLPEMEQIHISYILYPKTKALCDISNICSIHRKFFEDALTELGKIPDDNYKHIIGSSESFSNVDKDNPRVDICISTIKD